MKAFDPPPFATETDKTEYNMRILLARCVIERAFGSLKERWVFCKRNVFWNLNAPYRRFVSFHCSAASLHVSICRTEYLRRRCVMYCTCLELMCNNSLCPLVLLVPEEEVPRYNL
jgi:hypothetical protein